MFEYCSNEQKASIVDQTAPQVVDISLNMHGTRAVQKMIEFVTDQEQISILIDALSANVVFLIKDLNGNHVIQKCLNKLSHENNQVLLIIFISFMNFY